MDTKWYQTPFFPHRSPPFPVPPLLFGSFFKQNSGSLGFQEFDNHGALHWTGCLVRALQTQYGGGCHKTPQRYGALTGREWVGKRCGTVFWPLVALAAIYWGRLSWLLVFVLPWGLAAVCGVGPGWDSLDSGAGAFIPSRRCHCPMGGVPDAPHTALPIVQREG